MVLPKLVHWFTAYYLCGATNQSLNEMSRCFYIGTFFIYRICKCRLPPCWSLSWYSPLVGLQLECLHRPDKRSCHNHHIWNAHGCRDDALMWCMFRCIAHTWPCCQWKECCGWCPFQEMFEGSCKSWRGRIVQHILFQCPDGPRHYQQQEKYQVSAFCLPLHWARCSSICLPLDFSLYSLIRVLISVINWSTSSFLMPS